MPYRLLACVILLTLLFAPAVEAGNRRLSAAVASSDVGDRALTPDGLRAVYLHDASTDDVVEVWSVPVAGGPPVKLNAALGANESVYGFRIAPDSSRIVYFAANPNDFVFELYGSPIGGGAGSGVKLNEALAAGATLIAAEFLPDSSRVVFAVSYDSNTTRELWSATPDDTDVDNLVTLPAGREVDSFRFSPDSTHVLYVAEAANGSRELWSVPAAGGVPVLLSTGLPAGRTVTGFAISPDSSTAVYAANRDGADLFELFRVPVSGGTPVQVTPETAGTARVQSPRYAPSGARVTYVFQAIGSGIRQLRSIEPDGDGDAPLNPSGFGDAGLPDDEAYRISPDSQRVVYLAAQLPDQFELYTVPIAGGAATRLNGTLQPNGDVLPDFAIAPGGQRVVYRAGEVVSVRSDLYSVPIVGGATTRLTPEFEVCFTGLPQLDQLRFAVNADGSQVFFSQCIDPLGFSDMGTRLWSVPVSGGPIGRVDSCTLGCNVARPFFASPTRPNQVLYAADQDTDDELALYLGDTTCLYCDGFEDAAP